MQRTEFALMLILAHAVALLSCVIATTNGQDLKWAVWAENKLRPGFVVGTGLSWIAAIGWFWAARVDRFWLTG